MVYLNEYVSESLEGRSNFSQARERRAPGFFHISGEKLDIVSVDFLHMIEDW